MIWLVSVVLAVAALPPLAARAAGGRPPGPLPKLAALAPLAVLPAAAAVAVAAAARWWLALVLAIPFLVLAAWQLPAWRRARPGQPPEPDSGVVRMLTLNAQGGRADQAAVVAAVRRHRADLLAVQELTPDLVTRLGLAGLGDELPHSRLDPRPGSPGTGLWSRWPLTARQPLPGTAAAAPRVTVSLPGGREVAVTAVHTKAPVGGHERAWQRELAGLAAVPDGGPQIVAGDFNATRDHRPFRDLLAAGFSDCADTARRRPWPGMTWPASPLMPAVMRLDHVLIRGPGVTARRAGIVRVPGTDHRGVFAVIELP